MINYTCCVKSDGTHGRRACIKGVLDRGFKIFDIPRCSLTHTLSGSTSGYTPSMSFSNSFIVDINANDIFALHFNGSGTGTAQSIIPQTAVHGEIPCSASLSIRCIR